MTFEQLDINMIRFKYVVKKEGIAVIKKTLFSVNERFVPFEDIGSEILKERKRKLGWLILTVLFFILALSIFIRRSNGAHIGNDAEVFWLFLSAASFIIYAFTRKNSLFLYKDDETTSIEFLGTGIYKKRLNKFITELLRQRDNYFANKYPSFEGLSFAENMNCINASVQPADGLFLKKLTKHPLEKLKFEAENSPDQKPYGIQSMTSEKNARRILKDHQDKFISEGKYIFISGFSNDQYVVGLIGKTADPYRIMEYARTNGANYDIETKDIIAKYKQWDEEFGIRSISIGADFCECEIENKNIDYRKLADEVHEFCPDLVEQGTGTVEILEAEIKKTGRIFLWWD